MLWEYKDDRPIYLQIVEKIKLQIVSGAYQPGDKLMPVREFAAEAAVNPNTMQKALCELEREGLVFSQRTAGRFITDDQEMIRAVKQTLATQQINNFFNRMNAIGYNRQETFALLSDAEIKEEQ